MTNKFFLTSTPLIFEGAPQQRKTQQKILLVFSLLFLIPTWSLLVLSDTPPRNFISTVFTFAWSDYVFLFLNTHACNNCVDSPAAAKAVPSWHAAPMRQCPSGSHSTHRPKEATGLGKNGGIPNFRWNFCQ